METVFDKRAFKMLRAVAVIMLVFHHAFGVPSWLLNGLDYSNFYILSYPLEYYSLHPMRLCVGLFAFMTGYAYAYCKTPDFMYSLKKIFQVLIKYWIILVVFFIAAVLLGVYQFSPVQFVTEFLAMNDPLVTFGWYIYFYCFSMIALWALNKFVKGGKYFELLFPLLVCVLFRDFFTYLHSPFQFVLDDLRECAFWFPCVSVGYWVAKYNGEEVLKKYFHTDNLLWMFVIIVGIMAARVRLRELYGLNVDCIYAPFLAYYWCCIFRKVKVGSIIEKVLMFLGDHNFNIWLISSVFYGCLAPYTQWLAYLPKFPLLVVVWIILLCIVPSIIVEFIYKLIMKPFKKDAAAS